MKRLYNQLVGHIGNILNTFKQQQDIPAIQPPAIAPDSRHSTDKFRFHVLGIPHTRTTLDYSSCAYTQKVFKFCKMMHRRGHTIYHYGVEGSCPESTENVSVVPNEVYDKIYGNHSKLGPYEFDGNDECYSTFYQNAIDEVGKRKQPGDFILPFWGYGTKPICDAHPDLITVEPGIGYIGAFAEYRVYESYAWMNCQLTEHSSPNYYYRVIPNYFDIDDFDYSMTHDERLKNPYFLYLGRVSDCKGVNIAMQVCEKLGVKLIIAGPLSDVFSDYTWPDYVEYVGAAGVNERRQLMSNAIASFMPTAYSEPFGGVQVENMLSGTPVITPDWGAFSEVNIQGVTGYRCHTFDDYLNAAMDCLDGKIDRIACRVHGKTYSLDSIAPKYEKFFSDIKNVYDAKGWYQLSEKTEQRIKSRKQ